MNPAISSLEVAWAFVIEGLEIQVFGEGDAPRHLILTGPNGTGKSSILLGLRDALQSWPTSPVQALRQSIAAQEQGKKMLELEGLDDRQRSQYQANLEAYSNGVEQARKRALVEPTVRGVVSPESLVVAHFPANRRFQPQPVSGPLRFTWPAPRAAREDFSRLFLQFLVNRRSEQAFAREGGDEQTADATKQWFEGLEGWLGNILQCPDLQLKFDAKTFMFSLLIEGHEVGFDTLPDGFASILTLWTDILLRVEAIEGEATGFVLIDEPELHLHPSLQEELLPFLTRQFPGLQFIVATHSPMVATSLGNATVYDLELRRAKHGQELQGFRYGNVLKSHFGLRTDFDSATTAKLDRLYTLGNIDVPSAEEVVEKRRLAGELAKQNHLLALEVLKEVDDD